ncbi:MAG: MoxR family ATPase [Planctomycetes bacterium]|nr:MoxR family ATPase [Planctomycetota bacterium]
MASSGSAASGSAIDVQRIAAEVAAHAATLARLRGEVGKVLVGQEAMVSRLLIALLTGGHVLLEGVPGLAKTTAIRTLAQAIDAPFRRIQFTPDLLPADLLGTLIFNPREGSFTTRKGPIFSTFVLADEINRAPSKVQSALLEAMQERQVTIGDQSYPLDPLFLVLATQNPIEQEGTYPLPEAQVDRFMLKVKVGYPSLADEKRVVGLALERSEARVAPVAKPADLLAMRGAVERIYVDEQVRDYALALVQATRDPAKAGLAALKPLLAFGASPRASIALVVCARALAFLEGAAFVTPQQIKDIAHDVLRHRVLLTYEAEAEGLDADALLDRLLAAVPVP